MTPLESDPVHAVSAQIDRQIDRLPQNAASLLSTDAPTVVMTTWKLAQNGDGSVVRLEGISGKPTTIHLKSAYLDIRQAWICNALEDNEKELQINADGATVAIPAFGFVTLRLRTEPHLKNPAD